MRASRRMVAKSSTRDSIVVASLLLNQRVVLRRGKLWPSRQLLRVAGGAK